MSLLEVIGLRKRQDKPPEIISPALQEEIEVTRLADIPKVDRLSPIQALNEMINTVSRLRGEGISFKRNPDRVALTRYQLLADRVGEARGEERKEIDRVIDELEEVYKRSEEVNGERHPDTLSARFLWKRVSERIPSPLGLVKNARPSF